MSKLFVTLKDEIPLRSEDGVQSKEHGPWQEKR
jgi:hypothetical protein